MSQYWFYSSRYTNGEDDKIYGNSICKHEYTGKYKSTIKQTKSIASERRDVLPDSGEREATQMASMTKYTGTEVGDEHHLNKSRKCPTPGNSGREGTELSIVELSVFTRWNPSRDIPVTLSWLADFKNVQLQSSCYFFCHSLWSDLHSGMICILVGRACNFWLQNQNKNCDVNLWLIKSEKKWLMMSSKDSYTAPAIDIVRTWFLSVMNIAMINIRHCSAQLSMNGIAARRRKKICHANDITVLRALKEPSALIRILSLDLPFRPRQALYKWLASSGVVVSSPSVS